MRGFDKLKENIPSLYAPAHNRNIKALLEAWGVGDDIIDGLCSQAKDALFVSRANGEYLSDHASNLGIEKPDSVSDEVLRGITQALRLPKQIRSTIYELARCFYTDNQIFSFTTSLNVEPFNWTSDVELNFEFGDELLTITLRPGHFSNPLSVSADDVVNVLNYYLEGKLLAKSINGAVEITAMNQDGLLVSDPSGILSFSPIKISVLDSDRYFAVFDAGNEVTVVLPATPMVEYNPDIKSPYLNQTSYLSSHTAKLVPSAVSSTLVQDLNASLSPQFIEVNDPSSFPDSGYIYINYGVSKGEGPIEYSKTGTQGLFLGGGYVFKKAHPAGALVSVMNENKQIDGYLIDTIAIRKYLEKLILDTIALGVKVNFKVQYPHSYDNLNPYEK